MDEEVPLPPPCYLKDTLLLNYCGLIVSTDGVFKYCIQKYPSRSKSYYANCEFDYCANVVYIQTNFTYFKYCNITYMSHIND